MINVEPDFSKLFYNYVPLTGLGTCFEFAIQIACSLSGDDNSADVHEALAKPMML